jgi:hypothetical protein
MGNTATTQRVSKGSHVRRKPLSVELTDAVSKWLRNGGKVLKKGIEGSHVEGYDSSHCMRPLMFLSIAMLARMPLQAGLPLRAA